MTTYQKLQQRLDAHIEGHRRGEEAARHELQRALRGLRWDDRSVEDGGIIQGGWSDRRTNPSDWAIEQLARMVVTDSAHFQELGIRADAGETRLFATMLKHVVARAVPTLYLPNQARQAFPIDNSIPAGARTAAFHRIEDKDDDDLGHRASKADDIKIVELEAEEMIYRLASFARGFEWDMDELEEAAFAGNSLSTEGLAALNRAAERVFELVSLQGYASSNIPGAYNDANVTITGVVTGAWGAATADQVMGDIRQLVEAVKIASGDNFTPNRLLVPANRTRYLNLRRAETDLNVRRMIQDDYPGMQVMEMRRANEYDAAGTGPRMMAFTYSPDLIKVVEPRRFTLETPERHGYTYRVIGRQKLGGTAITVPLSAGYMDNI
jgi:hypothetical protein